MKKKSTLQEVNEFAKANRVWLNLGCGVWLRKDFINVDKYLEEKPLRQKIGFYKNAKIEKGAKFVKADIKKMPFPDEYADYVELMNTIEHFPMRQVFEYMKEIYRVMKKGARLVILTNSFDGLAVDWLQMQVQSHFDPERYYDIAEPIYGNQYGDTDGETHKCPFTKEFMSYVLYHSGFRDGEIILIPKGAVIPKIGTLPSNKKRVARTDLLVVDVKK